MFSPNRKKLSISIVAALFSCAASAASSELMPNTTVVNDVSEDLVSAIRAPQKQNRYIVTFRANSDELAKTVNDYATANTQKMQQDPVIDLEKATGLLEQAGAEVHLVLAPQGMIAASMNNLALEKLLVNPSVESISPDEKRELMTQKNPYGINAVQATQLSQFDTSASKVCVIDTGYDLDHPDLADENSGVTGQSNNEAVGDWFTDGHGHGTHVAGIIAALDNDIGSVGVFPGVNLHVVKIFDDNGDWTYASDLIDGINQCQQAGANVINMSLGGDYPSGEERAAMDQASENGVLLVAAAGNGGNSEFSYPASYDAVVSVGAVNSKNIRPNFSQFNSQVELAAPGLRIYSTYKNSQYARMSGTSMAAPHVAGAAALVWSFYPECTNADIRNALNASAEDLGDEGRDDMYGHGIVKAADAVEYLSVNPCTVEEETQPVEPFAKRVRNIKIDSGQWHRITLDVPAGAALVNVRIYRGNGDVDLYMNHGEQPELDQFECRPRLEGNEETCEIVNPESGQWHIGLHGYASTTSSVTIKYSYE